MDIATKRKKKRTLEDVFVDTIVYVTLILLTLLTIIPFMQVVTVSMSPPEVVSSYGIHLIPLKFNWDGYRKILAYQQIWTGYQNTIVRVILGIIVSMTLMILAAYPLSKKNLVHRKFWTIFMVFTMFFSGGLIPTYLIVKGVGLYNSVWALVLPVAINTFTMLIIRNYFMSLPEEIQESARIDGANEFVILMRIILPISVPILATVGLWTLVYHWNEWFNAMIYLKDSKKAVLQLVLRKIMFEGSEPQAVETVNTIYANTDTMKMAALMVSLIPLLVVYPFMQKYFVKGVMIGSLKG
ncbi:ABC transporter permease subunit [Paenibacillus sp. LMG 31461]|uniref:ABC transporter permease subunit n=1 Tax=Paenibacillus plantarum TaxID=2654975 RepID=A0ABX1X9Z6_9BACL|nr:carbohydrate ABC transporter permease [Paenibacillus plantarum]NOU64775.1 ABC transporter permease subunit [Paenibacillus plantarum]